VPYEELELFLENRISEKGSGNPENIAHYFKSLEYRRLEQGSEEPKP